MSNPRGPQPSQNATGFSNDYYNWNTPPQTAPSSYPPRTNTAGTYPPSSTTIYPPSFTTASGNYPPNFTAAYTPSDPTSTAPPYPPSSTTAGSPPPAYPPQQQPAPRAAVVNRAVGRGPMGCSYGQWMAFRIVLGLLTTALSITAVVLGTRSYY